MKKYLFPLFLSLPFLILLAWTLHYAIAAACMPQVTLPIAGYDPRSLLSGHYIRYNIDWGAADCTQFSDNVCPLEDFEPKRTFFRYHRFYVPQQYAQALDLALASQSDWTFEVVYAYASGMTPIAKRLLINGQDWQAIIINKEGE